MKETLQFKSGNSWLIGEHNFSDKKLGKMEAVLSLGNGYIGIRSATEEEYVGEKRNTFVAGTFNKFSENEVTELPNVPDVISMKIFFNGVRLDLNKGKVTQYKRILNLRNGELIRSFRWEYQDIDVYITFKRFVSFAQKHLIAQKVEFENLGKDLNVEILSGIDGQVVNSGSQHFFEGDKSLVDGKYLQMFPKTTQSAIDFVLTSVHSFVNKEVNQRIEMDRRKIYYRYWFDLSSQEKVTVEKLSNIHTSIDLEHEGQTLEIIRNEAVKELTLALEQKYDYLLMESTNEWNQQVWENCPIEIESSQTEDQLAIHFAQYHLHIMTPKHDERMNIGAKGLSGEGYKGHTFWDTEIFMLPYFIFTHPEIAQKLVTYRYLGLQGARRKAQENGFEGAQYPWEAAWPSDGETTPVWGAADIITGQPTKIWSGFIEQHITSDVTFGIKQYIDVTGDSQFANEKGYEIIFDTAKFWASRVEWIEQNKRYEILNVVGPDEYKEHVDNNAFTNYTAHWNITLAIKTYNYLTVSNPTLLSKLRERLDLDRVYQEWLNKVDLIYLPKATDEGVLPQDDEYLTKEIIDLSKYKSQENVGVLFHDYNLEQVNNMQVTKQADVLLLIYLFEQLFDKKLKLTNWNYYEPKTLHDSSLSLATHAVLAADLGLMEESYRLFKKAIRIDMGVNPKSSDAGIHAGAMGGIWQSVVLGYGGLRCLDGKLRIEPHLPKNWQSLKYGFYWQNNHIVVEINKEERMVRNNGNVELVFTNGSKEFVVPAKQDIIF